jgi:hypothetical protein
MHCQRSRQLARPIRAQRPDFSAAQRMNVIEPALGTGRASTRATRRSTSTFTLTATASGLSCHLISLTSKITRSKQTNHCHRRNFSCCSLLSFDYFNENNEGTRVVVIGFLTFTQCAERPERYSSRAVSRQHPHSRVCRRT